MEIIIRNSADSSFIEQIPILITIITFIFTSIGIGSALIERYVLANKFGIPFNMTYNSVSDIANLFISFFIKISVGTILPLLIIAYFSQSSIFNNSVLNNIIIFMLFFAILFFCTFTLKFIQRKIPLKKNVIFLIILLLLFLSTLFTYFIHSNYTTIQSINDNSNGIIFLISYIVIVLYISFMFCEALYQLANRFVGEIDEVIIVHVNGIAHIIIMRHNSKKWVLTPCEIDFQSGINKKHMIYYSKGNFIFKNIDEMNLLKLKCTLIDAPYPTKTEAK